MIHSCINQLVLSCCVLCIASVGSASMWAALVSGLLAKRIYGGWEGPGRSSAAAACHASSRALQWPVARGLSRVSDFQGASRLSVCLSTAVRAACISVSGLCRHWVFQWFCHHIRHPHVVTKKLIPNTIAQLQQYSFDFNVTSINIQCQNCSINRFISESCHMSYSWPGVVNTRLRWNLSSKFKFDG